MTGSFRNKLLRFWYLGPLYFWAASLVALATCKFIKYTLLFNNFHQKSSVIHWVLRTHFLNVLDPALKVEINIYYFIFSSKFNADQYEYNWYFLQLKYIVFFTSETLLYFFDCSKTRFSWRFGDMGIKAFFCNFKRRLFVRNNATSLISNIYITITLLSNMSGLA